MLPYFSTTRRLKVLARAVQVPRATISQKGTSSRAVEGLAADFVCDRGFRAEPFAHFLNTRGLHFTFKRPLDMTKVGLTVFVLGSIVVGCIFFWPAIHAVIGHKYLWAAVVLVRVVVKCFRLWDLPRNSRRYCS